MDSRWSRRFGSTLLFTSCLLISVIAVAQEQTAGAGAHEKPQTTAKPPSPTESTISDNQWHIDIDSYLCFAGVHGTIGALGRDVSVHASAGDADSVSPDAMSRATAPPVIAARNTD
jgi:hypothetical protein